MDRTKGSFDQGCGHVRYKNVDDVDIDDDNNDDDDDDDEIYSYTPYRISIHLVWE